MGIKKLNKYLSEKNIIKFYSTLSDIKEEYYRNKEFAYICIDTNLYLYKYLYSWGKFKYSFLNQIMTFITNGFVPIYVFDGKAPKEKSTTLLFRRNKKKKIMDKIQLLQSVEQTDEVKATIENLHRKNISICNNDIMSLKYMLDILGLPYCHANGESDVLCAELCKAGVTDLCLTEDMDILAFGCPCMIKFGKNSVQMYHLDTILSTLQINQNQFIAFCTLLGCDYCKSIRIDNVESILDVLKRASTVDDVFTHYSIVKSLPYKTAMEIFTSSHLNEQVSELPVFDIAKINHTVIDNYMVENNFLCWQTKHINELAYNILHK